MISHRLKIIQVDQVLHGAQIFKRALLHALVIAFLMRLAFSGPFLPPGHQLLDTAVTVTFVVILCSITSWKAYSVMTDRSSLIGYAMSLVAGIFFFEYSISMAITVYERIFDLPFPLLQRPGADVETIVPQYLALLVLLGAFIGYMLGFFFTGSVVVQNGTLCPACGYNLTGNESNLCPECGRRFEVLELRQLVSQRVLSKGETSVPHGQD